MLYLPHSRKMFRVLNDDRIHTILSTSQKLDTHQQTSAQASLSIFFITFYSDHWEISCLLYFYSDSPEIWYDKYDISKGKKD